MVYNQARLDEALLAFREYKEYLGRRGLKSGALEVHLGHKYEFRKPPSETAFAPRPNLWSSRSEDNSDEEFDPSKGKKQRHARELKPQRKRRLSISEDESSNKKKQRRNQKRTTWARGRREGRSMVVIYTFKKPDNLKILKNLNARHKVSCAKAKPQDQVTNVFDADLDSRFTTVSNSDLPRDPHVRDESGQKQDDKIKVLQIGETVVERSLDLPTPRSSISSLEGLSNDTQLGLRTSSDTDNQYIRGLRNRAISVKLVRRKKCHGCLYCKGESLKCNLLTCLPGYEGPCDACEALKLDCRISKNDEPRMGPLTRRLSSEGSRKRVAEDDSSWPNKRRGAIGSILGKDEELDFGMSKPRKRGEPPGGLAPKKRQNVRNVFSIDDESDSPESMHRKIVRSVGDERHKDLLSPLIDPGKEQLEKVMQRRSLKPLNTSLARSASNLSSQRSSNRDSGHGSALFSQTADCLFDSNKGNNFDTAITLSDTSSPPASPASSFEDQGGPSFSADPTTTITTSWAQPISFQHRPLQSGVPCDFCADFRYGLFGLGTLTSVEVAWDDEIKGYIELGGGHTGTGHAPTKMCAACSLERLRIVHCGRDCKGKGKEEGNPREHEMVLVGTWKGGADTVGWARQLKMGKEQEGYSPRPSMPSCHLCMMPALWRCNRRQARDALLRPLQGGGEGKLGCGLRLCGRCKGVAERGGWEKGRLLEGVGKFRRADSEWLFRGGLMEGSWERHLRSVGLL